MLSRLLNCHRLLCKGWAGLLKISCSTWCLEGRCGLPDRRFAHLSLGSGAPSTIACATAASSFSRWRSSSDSERIRVRRFSVCLLRGGSLDSPLLDDTTTCALFRGGAPGPSSSDELSAPLQKLGFHHQIHGMVIRTHNEAV